MSKPGGGLADEIAGAIGQDGLMRLVQRYGGSRITVPAYPVLGELALTLGSDYQSFQRHFSGYAFDVPLLVTVRVDESKVIDALSQGLSADRISRDMRISRRRVFRIQERVQRSLSCQSLSGNAEALPNHEEHE